MRRRTLLRHVLVAFLVMSVVVGCGAQSEQIELKLGHGLSPSHPVHQAMEYMSDRLEEKSDGQMTIDVYPSEQLGTERQTLELLQLGSIDMTKVSSSVMESFSDPYKVFGLPYIFRNEAHRFAVLEGEVGKQILRSSTDVWLRGLTYYDAGSRSFYTVDTPIREPSDLEGMKIRVQQSPAAIQLINELGASATPISFGELYTALQQGVVDGAENNAPSFHLTAHYELCNYYCLDRHTSPPDVLLISTHTWETLTEQQKKWVREAAWESLQHQKKLWDEATAEAMKTVKEAGVEIIEPDISKFREAVKPIYKDYQENQPRVYEFLEKVRGVEVDSADTTQATPEDAQV